MSVSITCQCENSMTLTILTPLTQNVPKLTISGNDSLLTSPAMDDKIEG